MNGTEGSITGGRVNIVSSMHVMAVQLLRLVVN